MASRLILSGKESNIVSFRLGEDVSIPVVVMSEDGEFIEYNTTAGTSGQLDFYTANDRSLTATSTKFIYDGTVDIADDESELEINNTYYVFSTVTDTSGNKDICITPSQVSVG